MLSRRVTKPVVIVGSSGNIGTATIKALHAFPKLPVKVGVRDVAKFGSLPASFQVIHADMSDLSSLDAAFKGAESVLVIPPSTEDRASLAINAINAAKIAKVHHIILVSLATVDVKIDHIFQKQFQAMEYALKSTGVKHTIVRLPMFVDNLWGNAESVKTQGAFYGAVHPDAPYAPVVVSDVGEALARILNHPHSYHNKILRLTAPTSATHNHIAEYFSRALGKPIKYVHVTPETAKQAMLGKGYPEWQVDGMLEYYKLIEAGVPEATVPTTDLQRILGHGGTSVDSWVYSVKPGFQ
jgi:uncharacterized protein YbjT (DUF2867 family)